MSPDFLPPARCDFSHAEKGENGLFKEKPSTKAVFPFSRGKNRISQGVESRGSLISLPLALREITINSLPGPSEIHLQSYRCFCASPPVPNVGLLDPNRRLHLAKVMHSSSSRIPRGPCETSRCLGQFYSPHCLATILDSQFPSPEFRKRAEYGFGEYGFKHRTQ